MRGGGGGARCDGILADLSNLKEMPALYERRLAATTKLENAQVALVQKAFKRRHNHELQVAKAEKKGKEPPPLEPATKHGADGAELSLADELVPHSERPTMRLKPSWSPISLGFLGIGEKVDVIHWARKEISECTDQLDRSRDQLGRDIANVGIAGDNYPPLNSAFILFNQQIAAHMAHQCLNYRAP